MENSKISSSWKQSVIKGFNFRDDRLMDKMWIRNSNVNGMTMFFRVRLYVTRAFLLEKIKVIKVSMKRSLQRKLPFLLLHKSLDSNFVEGLLLRWL